MTKYSCTSCDGVYDPDQHGGYYHMCPEGTRFPRNENWPISGKARDRGGAVKLKTS